MADYTTLLAQIPLIKSPSVQIPSAVHLPYQYTALPPSLSAVPVTDVSRVLSIAEETKTSLQTSTTRETDANDQLERYLSRTEKRKVEEARRVAPGYLDSGVRMLQPTASIRRPNEEQADEKGDGKEGNGEGDELDRAFGKVGISS
ncbi:hypothetical protein YB2330_005964 [Saitoella coloradoensis]